MHLVAKCWDCKYSAPSKNKNSGLPSLQSAFTLLIFMVIRKSYLKNWAETLFYLFRHEYCKKLDQP